MEVHVTDDPATECAELLQAAAARGAQIALTGGSTPRVAYERAAALGGDWSRATLWWGDDRCVAPGDERSNFGMAKAALLDHVDPQPGCHRIAGELGPDEGAAAYERELRAVFADGVPRLDLILLGLGPDGHVASIFPGKPAVDVREGLVVGVPEPGLEPFVPRVTMTLPVLCAGRSIVFLVTGADKAEAVARAFGGDPNPAVPASLVRPDDGTLTLLLDEAAAGKLERGT